MAMRDTTCTVRAHDQRLQGSCAACAAMGRAPGRRRLRDLRDSRLARCRLVGAPPLAVARRQVGQLRRLRRGARRIAPGRADPRPGRVLAVLARADPAAGRRRPPGDRSRPARLRRLGDAERRDLDRGLRADGRVALRRARPRPGRRGRPLDGRVHRGRVRDPVPRAGRAARARARPPGSPRATHARAAARRRAADRRAGTRAAAQAASCDRGRAALAGLRPSCGTGAGVRRTWPTS